MRFHKIAKRTNLSPKPKESVSTALFWSYSSSIICSISGTGLIFSVSWVICRAPFRAFFHLVTYLGHSQDKTSVNQIPYCNSKGWVCTKKQRWGLRQTAFGVVKIQSVLTSDKPSHLDTNNKNQHKSALTPKEKQSSFAIAPAASKSHSASPLHLQKYLHTYMMTWTHRKEKAAQSR